ncbi:MAG: 4-hydroxy-tetrahydrodipicolinate reductase [Spirochaetaceae bacterium]|jgi:4-hydroxy-tetrahydrodipicolinate reductase|nr:4-hydroxy-tetrahydrodipicolinate reductase [Spirochaetaceae bacterium]
MRIAIIGYGKMGKLIEAQALSRQHEVIAVVDPYVLEGHIRSGAPVFPVIPEEGIFRQVDVAIDFTRPDRVVENIKALAERKIPLLVGTTGWLDRLDEVTQYVESAGASMLWASNFSLGVNLFYRIAAFAAHLVDPFPEYDVGGWEAHHHQKVDSPSGTAKTLMDYILLNMQRKTTPVWETLHRAPAPEEIHYPSLRVGALPGTHTVLFDSNADTIEITHTARSRDALASGALVAAEWLVACPGPGKAAGASRSGVFTLDYVLKDLLGV